MKIIKHFNIEFDYDNLFSFQSKIFELTKGNNLELLVQLFNDIGYDFIYKLEKYLVDNKIEFFRNDTKIELHKKIGNDLFNQFSEYGTCKYIPNENYTEKDFMKYIKNNSSVVFEFGYFHFTLDKKIDRDYHSIRYQRSNESKELKDLREYFENVFSFMSEVVESEYAKIKIVDNYTEPEPFDFSDTSAVEKIIYLNELGIIKFLRTNAKAGISNGSLASLLSAITGIRADTIKPSLNRLDKKDIDDNKHPYYKADNVSKIKKRIEDLGI